MTCIAWDGRELAGDKRASYGNGHYTVTKIQRIGDMLVGAAGSGPVAQAVFQWLREGSDPAKYPKLQEDKDHGTSVLVVRADGVVLEFGLTAWPIVREDKCCAIGGGRDFALAAMHLGCDARRAVEVACVFDTGCGNGIDTLTFDGVPKP